MRCVYCGFADTKVIDSRPLEERNSIKRRRECLSCGKRFTTFETVETQAIFVIKRDGRREHFDAQKLKRGVIKACEKCAVSMSEIDDIVENVKRKVMNMMEEEVPSKKVGDFLMEELKKVNEVAYVRFASVYREFKDASSFMNEIQELMKDKK